MKGRLLQFLVILYHLKGLAFASVDRTGPGSSALSFSDCQSNVYSDDHHETISFEWDKSVTDGDDKNFQTTENTPFGSNSHWSCTIVTHTADDSDSQSSDCSFRLCVSNTADQFFHSGNVTIHYKSCPQGDVKLDNKNNELAVEVMTKSGEDNGDTTDSDKPADAIVQLRCTEMTYTAEDAFGRTVTCSVRDCDGKAWVSTELMVVIIAVVVAVIVLCAGCASIKKIFWS